MNTIADIISVKLSVPVTAVRNTLDLLSNGSTVPFITRYRKEATGNLDEQQIRSIKDQQHYLNELQERKNTILKSIEEQGLLTGDLKNTIRNTLSKTELEDIYLPYKPKRKTRAVIAKEKGLTPLACRMLAQRDTQGNIVDIVKPFLNKSVPCLECALQGAKDIIAEQINEDANLRKRLRSIFSARGNISSSVKKDKKGQSSKYEMYYDFKEPAGKIPSHRMLAIFRGETEGFLNVKLDVPAEQIISEISKRVIRNKSCLFYPHLQDAVQESFKRLLYPSLTTDIRKELKDKSDLFAVSTFAKNLRHLLLAPPLGAKPLIALDPGFRSGIKVVVLDAVGNLVHHTVLYPLAPHNKEEESFGIIHELITNYSIRYIAVGNGTASRETESFIKKYQDNFSAHIECVMVNESGASVYSVSDCARDEFPDLDATVRGAVSIGRRLQDPLAELVKIDPKSLGVGQYQHDVNQTLLKQKLADEVEHCVNSVGVDLNTASEALLSYVAGIGKGLARNIVVHRNKKGTFRNRKELMNVPKFGAKAFEQSAGFLRIRNGSNPLDCSAIHPESYAIVNRILADLGTDIKTLMGNDKLIASIDKQKYITAKAGMETISDIIRELRKPGIDPRDTFSKTEFRDEVKSISDLKEDMILPGIVTNVTHFGAFVDIGVHQDGLVHISQLADQYVTDPCEVISVGQRVDVRVMSVDMERKRIALSRKKL